METRGAGVSIEGPASACVTTTCPSDRHPAGGEALDVVAALAAWGLRWHWGKRRKG
jgi:hypothetical protein